jgi:multicomponent K+:H+ antiporter subunit A
VTPLIRLVSTAILPIALLISMAHLIGAEEGPGDGFTAGIISSLGLTLEYLVFGYSEVHRRFRWLYFEYVLAGGLTIALVSAIVPILFGASLLSMQGLVAELPVLGDIKLTRAMLFDVGIYLVVFGGAMTAIDRLNLAGT